MATGGYSALTQKTDGEDNTFFVPRQPRGNYGVILSHGAGAQREFMDFVTQPSSVALAAALADAGIPCVAGPFTGDQHWAVDAALTSMDNAYAQLAARVPQMNATKCLILGVSMGAGAAARYAITRGSAEVAGIVGIIPAFDYAYEWNNVAVVRAAMGAAWGVTYPAPWPTAADQVANASLARDVPTIGYYSTADTTVPPTGVLNYLNAVNGTGIVVSTTLNHSDAAVGAASVPGIITWLEAHGA